MRHALAGTWDIGGGVGGLTDGDEHPIGIQDAGVWGGVSWHKSHDGSAIPLARVVDFVALERSLASSSLARSSGYFVTTECLPVFAGMKDFVLRRHCLAVACAMEDGGSNEVIGGSDC
jgi:hypothetical protein